LIETINTVGNLTDGDIQKMNRQALQELFVDQLQSLYDSEKQLTNTLSTLMEAADSEELSAGLSAQLERAENHVTRLEEVFETLGLAPAEKLCTAIQGLIEEGDRAVGRNEAGSVRDLMIIASAQKIKHYEISGYGTARTLAERLGFSDAMQLLQQSEDEEKGSDADLTDAAATLYEIPDE
jgi:ferritin-like metal-binding protein YciE